MQEIKRKDLVGKEILVVDDTPENLMLLVEILKKEKFKVRPVTNGTMALAVVEKFRPDLILLDINMPGINGYETCRRLKMLDSTAEVPVVFLSAMNETIDKLKAFEVGGIDYITKPYHVEEVLVRVETHLKLFLLQEKLENEVKKRTEQLFKMYENKKKFEIELKVASEIQSTMIPNGKLLSCFNGQVEMYGETYSAKRVEGDFFDYFLINDNKAFFCIGDISGKGIPAAIFMAKVKALLCYEVKNQNYDLQNILKQINTELLDENAMCMFASVFCGYVILDEQKILCCNAGHTYPIKSNSGGKYEVLEFIKHPVLGVFKAQEDDYSITEFSFEKGDTFFIYSDGISEAIDTYKKMYGIGRLRSQLNQVLNSSAKEVVKHSYKKVLEYVGNEPQFDDITLMCIKHNN